MKRIQLKGIVYGVIAALGVIAIFVGILSYFLLSGRIGEGAAEIGIVAGTGLAAAIGSFVSIGLSKGSKVVNCTLVAILVFTVLLIVGLFTDGKFDNVITRVISLTVGSLAACTLLISTTGKKNSIKRRYR